MKPLTTKLRALQKKSIEKGHWAVAAAVSHLLGCEENLDAQINVVGAMHEAGLLVNSLEPYWSGWRTVDRIGTWTQRCIERLRAVDSDYWAVAGLLGLPMGEIRSALAARSYTLLAVRYAEAYKDGRWLIASFCGSHSGRTLVPIIEVGWGEDAVVCEASRWRAVILDEQSEVEGSLVGRGGGAYYMRAKLPYGCWRIHHDTFELKADWIVPRRETLLSGYP